MSKVLTFKVEIEGLENKIWRKIENKSIVTIEHIEKAIINSKAIYPDVIKKGVEDLRIEFKDLFDQEEQIRRDFLKSNDE